MVGALSGRSVLKGLLSGGFGLMLSMVGFAQITGALRYTLETLYLWDGIKIVPIAIGLFGLPELIELSVKRTRIADPGIHVGSGLSSISLVSFPVWEVL